jgi:acyl carrier protein
LLAGATVHVGELSVISSGFITYLQQHKISSIAGVPYTYEMLERADFTDKELPELRYITQAGGRLSTELVNKYTKWSRNNNKQFFVMYGQTEATARMSYVPQDKLVSHPDSIGIAIPGGSFFIRSEAGRIIEVDNEPGELIYRGDNVMMGYADNPAELGKGNEYDELPTGDVAYKNNEGLFFIVGRLKRFTKIYGKRFNLDDIEKKLSDAGIAAVCVSDDKTLYVCSEAPIHEDIYSSIENSCGIAKQNIYFVKFTNLSLLSSGKVDYQTIFSVAKEQRDIEIEKQNEIVQTQLYTQDAVLTIYQRFLKNQQITPEDSFFGLGGDSMTYVGLSIELEKTLGYLPDSWQTMKIVNLKPKRNVSKVFAKVEIDILLRVYAIVAVVCNHAGLGWVQGGAVLLLLLAGYNYARFQLGQQLLKKPLRIFSSFSLTILLPCLGVLVGFSIMKYHTVYWPDVLMISNNLSTDRSFQSFGLWFVQVLLQSMILFTLPLLFLSVRRYVKNNTVIYAAWFLMFACLLRVADETIGWGHQFNLGGEQLSWAFWLFALGVFIQVFSVNNSRWLLSLLLITLCALFYASDTSRALTLIVGGLLLIWVGSVNVPRLCSTTIKSIAAGSLFIYMLHPRAPADSFSANWEVDVVRIVGGITIGIVVFLVYSKLFNTILSRLQDFWRQAKYR